MKINSPLSQIQKILEKDFGWVGINKLSVAKEEMYIQVMEATKQLEASKRKWIPITPQIRRKLVGKVVLVRMLWLDNNDHLVPYVIMAYCYKSKVSGIIQFSHAINSSFDQKSAEDGFPINQRAITHYQLLPSTQL